MSWETKEKIPQEGSDEKIFTPNGQEILVGESEDQVLLHSREFNNWSLKTKIEP